MIFGYGFSYVFTRAAWRLEGFPNTVSWEDNIFMESLLKLGVKLILVTLPRDISGLVCHNYHQKVSSGGEFNGAQRQGRVVKAPVAFQHLLPLLPNKMRTAPGLRKISEDVDVSACPTAIDNVPTEKTLWSESEQGRQPEEQKDQQAKEQEEEQKEEQKDEQKEEQREEQEEKQKSEPEEEQQGEQREEQKEEIQASSLAEAVDFIDVEGLVEADLAGLELESALEISAASLELHGGLGPPCTASDSGDSCGPLFWESQVCMEQCWSPSRRGWRGGGHDPLVCPECKWHCCTAIGDEAAGWN